MTSFQTLVHKVCKWVLLVCRFFYLFSSFDSSWFFSEKFSSSSSAFFFLILGLFSQKVTWCYQSIHARPYGACIICQSNILQCTIKFLWPSFKITLKSGRLFNTAYSCFSKIEQISRKTNPGKTRTYKNLIINHERKLITWIHQQTFSPCGTSRETADISYEQSCLWNNFYFENTN